MPHMDEGMTTQRLIWVLWCLGWAGVWALLGIVTLGVTLIFAGLSLLAIALPVGRRRPPAEAPPAYMPVRRKWGQL